MKITQTVIKEPGSHRPAEYGQRVHRLALSYFCLTSLSIVGIAILIWRAKMFVTLAQRSNVETLTLGFFLVFFGYIGAISAPGAWGALRIAAFALQTRRARHWTEVDRRKADATRQSTSTSEGVALNFLVEHADAPRKRLRLELRDSAGSMGSLELDGAELVHRDLHKGSSNSLYAYFVHQVNEVVAQRGESAPRALLDIVEWEEIDEDSAQQYLAMVRFARNLEAKLEADELWPKLRLSVEECRELERRLSAICRYMRDEAFLPDWEYSGEHKLPLIPEPLGLVSLSRTEKRVDPVATMGCAVLIVAFAVLVFLLFVFFPPWVPGA